MVFVAAAVERAMKIQEVIMRALSGAISWLQAADIFWASIPATCDALVPSRYNFRFLI